MRSSRRILTAVFVFSLLLALLPSACLREHDVGSQVYPSEPLRLFLWEDSIPEELQREFERESGITLQVDYFSQLDVLMERVNQDPGRYDVIAPSDYAVKWLLDRRLLVPLPLSAVKLRDRIDTSFRQPWYDDTLTFCLPYQRSLSALAYNKKHISPPPLRWADVLDAERAKTWAGRMSLMDDARETLGIMLLAAGEEATTSDPSKIEKAAERLKKLVPSIVRFDSDRFEDGLIDGSLWIAHGFNGDLARACAANPDLAYVIPEEGALESVDNFAIPAKARHIPQAVRFIEFILRPENAWRIMAVQGLGSTLVESSLPKGDLPLDKSIVCDRPSNERTVHLHEKGETAAFAEKVWKTVRNF